jgi:CheY-like chemotaxis protein
MPQTVLIIEDTVDIAEALQILIEMQGYRAIVAYDGLEGCQLAEAERPDLILMDLALPGMDGLEATRHIRGQSKHADVPIVCVSSYARGSEEQLLAAGCNEVLSKSSFITNLVPTLKKYIGS